GGHGPVRLAPPVGGVPRAVAATAPGPSTRAVLSPQAGPSTQAGPLPTVPATRVSQPQDAGRGGSAADFIPGFGPRNHVAATVPRPPRPHWPPRGPRGPWLPRPYRPQRWLAAGTTGIVAVAVVVAIVMALWPASTS